jgi:hypothetical protein
MSAQQEPLPEQTQTLEEFAAMAETNMPLLLRATGAEEEGDITTQELGCFIIGVEAGLARGRAAAEAELESLRAECGLRQIRGYNEGKAAAEADRRDAERYRWLRDKWWDERNPDMTAVDSWNLDAEIDQLAMYDAALALALRTGGA